jgi:hypothetical protein
MPSELVCAAPRENLLESFNWDKRRQPVAIVGLANQNYTMSKQLSLSKPRFAVHLNVLRVKDNSAVWHVPCPSICRAQRLNLV